MNIGRNNVILFYASNWCLGGSNGVIAAKIRRLYHILSLSHCRSRSLSSSACSSWWYSGLTRLKGIRNLRNLVGFYVGVLT